MHFQRYPGPLWCKFPSSSLFPAKSFPVKTFTHTQYWELGSSPHCPATTPCRYIDDIPSGKQLQRESFVKTKFSHLQSSVKTFGGFFARLFLCSVACPCPVWQPAALVKPCLGPALASFIFLLHICPLVVRADMFCEGWSSILNSRW